MRAEFDEITRAARTLVDGQGIMIEAQIARGFERKVKREELPK
jgi:hypothetical protein